MPQSSHNLKPVLDWLERDTGLSLSDNREAVTLLGIERVMESVGIQGPFEFLGQLKVDRQLHKRLISQLTVGETYFFRDAGQFEFIKQHIIPSWRQSTQRRSVWSAGCSSGEEPYSLAIMFEEQGFGRRVDLFATDISEEALEMARRGVYRNWSLRGLTPESLGRFVETTGNEHRITDDIKARVRFSSLNLAQLEYPSVGRGLAELDLILCRNVLIYFRADVIKNVIAHMFESLAPGGWLILGATDPQVGSYAAWSVKSTTGGVFYRRPLSNEHSIPSKPDQADDNHNIPVARKPIIPSVGTQPRVQPQRVNPESMITPKSIAAAPASAASADLQRIKELSNEDPEAALKHCEQCIARTLTDPALHYLHAVLLYGLERLEPAAAAIRRTLFLDSTLAIAHFTKGLVDRRRRRLKDAARSFNSAKKLLDKLSPCEVVPLSDDMTAAELVQAVRDSLMQLEGEINE